MSVEFHRSDLEAISGYPQIAHVPIERLRLDPSALPLQRLTPQGQPICWGGNHPVAGGALLCDGCRAVSANLTQRRRRAQRRADEVISKQALTQVHEAVDALAPLINDLSVAYNNAGDLRDEVNRIMLHVKVLQRTIRDLVPDPRW